MQRLNAIRPAEHVLEVVTPRTNTARLTSAEHLFSALGLEATAEQVPVSLEIVGDTERRRFLARTTSPSELRRVAGQLAAAYPQATLRSLDAATLTHGDHARVGPDEQVAVATLHLRAGEYLPLRTFDDRELDGAGSSVQVDPLLGVLGALGDLPRGWRAMAQLVVLGPAPRNWAMAYQRLALERPLEDERRASAGPSPAGPLAIVGVIALYLLASTITAAWSRGDWLGALGLAVGTLASAVASIVVVRWLGRRALVDPRLV